MSLVKKSELFSSVQQSKRFAFSNKDYNRLNEKKILVDFDQGQGTFPQATILDLACQVVKPTLAFPDQDDYYGTRMWNQGCSEGLAKYHFLRFDEKMGLFVSLDECPSYLIQLLLQELSPRRLQLRLQSEPGDIIDRIDTFIILKQRIGSFDISAIVPNYLGLVSNCVIQRVSDAFMPSASSIVTFWFHGAKNQSLGPILTTLCYITNPHNTVIDIFSGSCAVAAKLSYYRPTIANDAEPFSAEVARALMSRFDVDMLDNVLNQLSVHFEKNKQSLLSILKPHVEKEEWLMWGSVTTNSLAEYQSLMDQYPIYSDDKPSWKLPENELISWKQACEDIETRRKERRHFPYCLLTYYFGNAYFGLRQAIELDSIRYSIDIFVDKHCAVEAKEELRSLLLAGLLSVASTMSSGPGHFAEYQRKFQRGNTRKIWAKRREKMAWNLFCERVRYFANERSPFLIKAYSEDWHGALKKCVSQPEGQKHSITTVYADPPMSDFQYSRFYHVLKTICKYDYPESEGRGLYRKDRFFSRFSSRSKACDEINDFVNAVSLSKMHLVLSYKPSGIIPLTTLYSIVNENYSDVLVLSYPVVYSSQGKRRKTTTKAASYEFLFIGRHLPNRAYRAANNRMK